MTIEKDYIKKLQFYIPEMSKAFHSDEENVNVWVENPNTYNNEYFKYYNHANIRSASKVARIKLRSPEYIKSHRDNKELWILNSSERKTLIELLNLPYARDPRITNWQQIIVTYNDDFFNIVPEDTIADSYDKSKFPQALSINMPMPDYTQLK